MSKPPPASTRNPAFQSKLEPYREFIRECRAKRWSYPRIAAALQESHGLSAAPSTIFSFVKVRARRRTSTRSLPRTIRQFSNPPQ
jgi:IS30 family transposase